MSWTPSPPGLPNSWCLRATGTTWRILTAAPLGPGLRTSLGRRIDAFEDVWSRFRPGSLVRALARGAPREPCDTAPDALVVDLPAGSGRLLDLYDRLHRATDGRLDPLVGSDLVELGYDQALTFRVRDGAASRVGAANDRPSWAAVASHCGDRLRLSEPALVDVGAAGKGFLADCLGGWLLEAGVEEFLIDASGDLLVRTHEPVRIGLEEPGRPDHRPGVIGVVELTRGAVCASGTHRRRWGPTMHHLLDALTGLPVGGPRAVLATWAVAADAATADALATCLFLAAPEALADAGFRFECALLRQDGTAAASRGLPGRLFTADEDRPAPDGPRPTGPGDPPARP